MKHVTISIPAYNDANTLADIVKESFAVLAKISDSHGVFVINDGSADHTSQVLKSLVQKYPNLQYLEHPKNLGFGATIKEAYTLPESEWIFVIPGDGQILPAELFKLYPLRNDYSFVLGLRKHRRDPWMRKFNSWGYNGTISLIAGRRVRDVNSVGLLKREVLDPGALKAQSAFIHAEILLQLARKRANIAEIEIEHKPRLHGRASGNRWPTIFSTIRDMLRYLRS